MTDPNKPYPPAKPAQQPGQKADPAQSGNKPGQRPGQPNKPQGERDPLT